VAAMKDRDVKNLGTIKAGQAKIGNVISLKGQRLRVDRIRRVKNSGVVTLVELGYGKRGPRKMRLRGDRNLELCRRR
jgi:hypothetical protein